ncbi:MAG: hypothetical protein ABI891_15325 [Acidobacteriota bacterium]
MVKPSYQVRMSPDECGQPTDCVLWDCSKCKREQILADDLSILSADIIEIGEIKMTNETKQQIKENETTLNRWKAERLSKILNQSVSLPDGAAQAFYKIIGEFTDGFRIETLREKIDAQMPKLWDFMPPPKNNTEWTEYFNDLLTDCAAEECLAIKEVWQIIGYDPNKFEEMRGNGFSFVEAFGELCMKETTEQMDERTKDLPLEQYKEQIEHSINQWREGQKEVARLQNDAFNKFGVNISLENGF